MTLQSLLAKRDDALALGTRADERDLDAERRLDEVDVRARTVRQPVGDRLLPPGERLVDGPAVMEVTLVRWKLERLGAVA